MSAWSGKPCARCGNIKGKRQANLKYCYRCAIEVRREKSRGAHAKAIGQRYGITGDDYNAVYEFQGGKCPICGRATGSSRRLSVDHDHKLGNCREAVRGLLCRPCNDMLGHARDDIAVFERAIEYLKDPPARSIL